MNTRLTLCIAMGLALLGIVASGCGNEKASLSPEERKAFATRPDPNNPPPEARAAMARLSQP